MEGFNFNSIESNSWDVYIQTLILRHYRHLRNELWFEDTKGGCLSKGHLSSTYDLLLYQEPQYDLSYQGMKEIKYSHITNVRALASFYSPKEFSLDEKVNVFQ